MYELYLNGEFVLLINTGILSLSDILKSLDVRGAIMRIYSRDYNRWLEWKDMTIEPISPMDVDPACIHQAQMHKHPHAAW